MRFRSSIFTSSPIKLSKRANWAGYEIASSPRDGRELRSGKEKHGAEAGTQVVLHSWRESCPDVPEDVHGTQLPETAGTAGTAERQHPLPDILRRDNRSDTPVDKLQAVGRRNDGTCQIDRDCNERFVRDTERTLRSLKGQGQDEADAEI